MNELQTASTETIPISAKIMRKLSLHDGTIVEGVMEGGKLLILQKKDSLSELMQFAGIWENENVCEVFKEIRKGWKKWRKISLA